MSPLLTTLISGLFVAVVTSVLTVWLALLRFHSEKWWERKAEVYSRLMEALFDMYLYNRQWLEDYTTLTDEVPAEEAKRKQRSEQLWTKHQAADLEVEKLAVIGAFVVSDAVAEDLMLLRKERATAMANFEHRDVYEVAEESLAAVKKCLGSVREHAKHDLGVTRKFSPLFEKVVPAATSVVKRLPLGV